MTGAPVRLGRSTLERWLYQARETQEPAARLRRQVRKDAGAHPSLNDRLRQVLAAQYRAHPSWSAKLRHGQQATDHREAEPRPACVR